jgi:hypothetical protein
MSLDPEILRAIRREIRTHMFLIGHAVNRAGGETPEDQALAQNYPGGPEMTPRPVAHPYGFCSVAPAATLAVTARIGEHPGATLTLAHRDARRATMPLAEGDATLYDAAGQAVGCVDGNRTVLGSLTADNPVVLGTELKELLTEIVDAIIQGDLVLITSPGNPSAPNPPVLAKFQEIKSRLIDTEATNILSNHVYSEKEAP